MKTAKQILCDHMDDDRTMTSILHAIKEIAGLAFDAGYKKGFAEGGDIDSLTNHPTYEQFINQLFLQSTKTPCLHDGKINAGHHVDQPCWCDKCGEEL